MSLNLVRYTRSVSTSCVLGLVFIAFNFAAPVQDLASAMSGYPPIPWLLTLLAQLPDLVFPRSRQANLALFWDMLVVGFYAAGVFGAGVLLLSLRRMNLLVSVSAAVGVIVGYAGVPLIAWMVVVVAFLLSLAWWLITLVWSLVSAILGFFHWILSFLAPYLGYLVLAAIGLGLLFGAFWLVRWLLGKYGFMAVVVGAIGAVLGYFSIPVLLWLHANVLVPLIAFLGWILGGLLWLLWWLTIGVLLVSFVFGMTVTSVSLLGALLWDQFVSSWNSGKGVGALFVGSFSVGLAFSSVVWASSAAPDTTSAVESAWHAVTSAGDSFSPVAFFARLLPPGMDELNRWIFAKAGPQVFDALTLLLMLGAAIVSVVRGLGFHQAAAFEVHFKMAEVTAIGVAIALAPIGLLVVAFAALTSKSESD